MPSKGLKLGSKIWVKDQARDAACPPLYAWLLTAPPVLRRIRRTQMSS